MSMAPGWYPDPFSVGYLRWWDGKAWSSQTQVAERTDATPAPQPAPSAPTYSATPPVYAAPAPPTYGAPPQPTYGAPPPTYGPPPPPYGAPPSAPPPPYGAPPPAPPWAGYQAYPTPPPGPTFPLASWGIRVAARLIDLMILLVVLAPLYIAVLWPEFRDFFRTIPTDGSQIDMQSVYDFETSIIGKAFALALVAALLQMVYEVPQLAMYGRTLGKRAVGIRVRSLAQDRNPSWGEAAGRTGVMAGGQLIGSGLFTLLDNLWPLWDRPWQQALHDKVVKTVVVPK